MLRNFRHWRQKRCLSWDVDLVSAILNLLFSLPQLWLPIVNKNVCLLAPVFRLLEHAKTPKKCTDFYQRFGKPSSWIWRLKWHLLFALSVLTFNRESWGNWGGKFRQRHFLLRGRYFLYVGMHQWPKRRRRRSNYIHGSAEQHWRRRFKGRLGRVTIEPLWRWSIGVRRTRSNFSSQPQLDEPNIKFGRTVPALHRLQLDLSHLQDQENSPEQIVIGSSSLKCLEDEITHLEGVGLTFKPKDHAKSNKRKVFKAIRRQSRTKSFSKRHPSVSSPRSSPAASPRKRPGSTIGNLVNRVNLSSSSQVHNPLGNLPKIWKSHTPRTSLSSSPTQSKLADIAPSLLLNSLSNVDDLQTEVDVVHLRKRRDAEQRQRELLLERRNARTKDKKVWHVENTPSILSCGFFNTRFLNCVSIFLFREMFSCGQCGTVETWPLPT